MADYFFGSIHDLSDDFFCPLLRLRHAVCGYVQHPASNAAVAFDVLTGIAEYTN